jgi:hypothetical protein
MISWLTAMAKHLKHFLAKHAKESKKILPDYVRFLGDPGDLCETHFLVPATPG